MKVNTSRFGEIEVPDETVITFEQGVIGFEDAKRFVIFDCGEEGIFKWLQSCDRPELAFVICEANLIVPDYQLIMGDKERKSLQLEQAQDAVVCLILVIPEDPQEATANLLGPIVMNAASRLGMQLVLVNPNYTTRYRIFSRSQSSPSQEEERKNAGA